MVAACMHNRGCRCFTARTSHSLVQVDANVRSNKGWAATEYKVHCFRYVDHHNKMHRMYSIHDHHQQQQSLWKRIA